MERCGLGTCRTVIGYFLIGADDMYKITDGTTVGRQLCYVNDDVYRINAIKSSKSRINSC